MNKKRLPKSTYPNRYEIELDVDLDNFSYTGAQKVDLNVVEATNNIVLNGSDLVFEGYLANAYETTLRVVEPTADNIVRLPDVSGDVITTGNLTKDGTASGDPLAAEGDAVAFAIALGG